MADHGPLHVLNRFPLFWMFLSPGTLPADQPRQGECDNRLALDYSSLYFDFHNDQWRWLMDMETTIVAISCTYGISDKWSMGVELPLIAMNSGFLDVFLEGFHNTLNVPNYGRELRPHNAYAFVVENNGETWIEGDSGQVAPADTTLFLSYQLTRRPSLKTGFSSSLTLGLQLPSGSRQQGYGSGGLDAGLYLPMQWNRKRTGVFLMPGYTFIGPDSAGDGNVNYRNTYHLSGGFSLAFNEKWYGVVQLDYHTSPIEVTQVSVVDNGALQLTFGLRRHMPFRGVIELSFSEDLTQFAPDFTVHLAWQWKFDMFGH